MKYLVWFCEMWSWLSQSWRTPAAAWSRAVSNPTQHPTRQPWGRV